MRHPAGQGQPNDRWWNALTLVFVLLLGGLLIGPLWQRPGIANTADGILHLHRSAEVARAWTQGVLWPRWFPGAYEGLGVPLFHYCSPFFYALVAPLHLLGLPLDAAVKLIMTVLFVVSGLAMYAWLRRLLSPAAGLVGATLYLANPLFFREYYFQGDYPQTFALFWFPVVLWAFTRLYEDDRWRNWLLASVSLAVLVVSHNITAMLGAAFLVLYWLALPFWRRSWRGWWRGVAAAALGGALSAFFWLPALGDSPLVRVNALREGFFQFSLHFVHLSDLLAVPPLLDSRALNPPFPHLLGWAAWLALAAGLVVVILPVFQRVPWGLAQTWAAAGLVITAIFLALTQAWSAAAWEHLPGLSLLQYPGRLLGPAAVSVALVGGAATHVCASRRVPFAVAGTVLIVALSSSVFLFPSKPFVRVIRFSEADTQAWERASGNWGATSSDSYLPRWSAVAGAHAGQEVQARVLPAGARWTWETPNRGVLQAGEGVSLPSGPLTLPLHYFPAWRAVAGAITLPTEPVDGLLGVNLTQPAQQVTLVWQGTAWEQRGEWVSRIALLGLMVGTAWAAFRRRRREAGRWGVDSSDSALATSAREPLSSGGDEKQGIGSDLRHQRHLRSVLEPGVSALLPALALLLLLIGARVTIEASGVGWFQRTSPPDAVSSAEVPLQISLGGDDQPGVKLLGWELLPDSQVRLGGELRVRLYWQAEERITQSLHSFVHLTTPSPKRSWAVAQNDNPGWIPTNDWSPTLYVVDDLALDLPLELPPTTYALAVGLVDENGQRLDVPNDPDGMVTLREISLAPLRTGKRQALHPSVAAPATFGTDLRLQGYDFLPAADAGRSSIFTGQCCRHPVTRRALIW